jgi:hypothetical protein
VTSETHAPYRTARRGTTLTLTAVTLSAIFAVTGCTDGKPRAAAATTTGVPAAPATSGAASSTPSSPRTTPGKDVGNVAAAKDGVTVKKPVLKYAGNSFWVGVDVANSGAEPAKYLTYIRLTGPLGYNALLRVQTDTVQPGEVDSAVYTARDEAAGAIIPKHPTVVVVQVVRTPVRST